MKKSINFDVRKQKDYQNIKLRRLIFVCLFWGTIYYILIKEVLNVKKKREYQVLMLIRKMNVRQCFSEEKKVAAHSIKKKEQY